MSPALHTTVASKPSTPSTIDVAQTGGVELLEQDLRLRHDHGGEQHVPAVRAGRAISLTCVLKSASARL